MAITTHKQNTAIMKMIGLSVIIAIIVIATTPVYAAEYYEEDIKKNYVQALKDMNKEILTAATHALTAISLFFDADMQIDTQREMQRLVARAHKDYQPGEQMCRFGTMIRSVARTEEKAAFDAQILNTQLMTIYNNKDKSVTALGPEVDIISRIAEFKNTYCDPADNNNSLGPDTGSYKSMCGTGAKDKNRINKDIDYTRTVGSHLTLDINYDDPKASDNEQDIYALARNLYWPTPYEPKGEKEVKKFGSLYQEIRRQIAMRNVAHNSYTNIVAEKSRAADGSGKNSGWNFMKALMKDFGLSDKEINTILGEYPSYYAQMDILTKKMYQSPNFYTNLYDKPVNIRRNSVSMEAIKLMQMRDHYNAALRREMLLSMMIEQEIAPRVKDINTDLRK